MSLTEPDPWGRYSDEEPAARIVRPYTITAGRTRSTVDLPMEATLVLEPAAHEHEWGGDLQGRIVEVCDRRSVAEVSAPCRCRSASSACCSATSWNRASWGYRPP